MDYAGLKDEQLADLARAGELSAFEELVVRHELGVYRFVLQICRTEQAAVEVTQDTFVRAFQSLHQYRGAYAFRGWLFAIARSRAMDYFRRTKVPSGEPLPEPASEDDPSRTLARREEAALAWRVAREKLSGDVFQALWLRYAEDMDVTQIAQVLGKTQTHVKVMLFRARKVLARELRVLEQGEERSAGLGLRLGLGL